MECVGVPVETVVALGNGVIQRPRVDMDAINTLIAKQTKIVKRTEPGIIVQVDVVVLKRKQRKILIGVKRLMDANMDENNLVQEF